MHYPESPKVISRQTSFLIFQNNSTKIGMNTTANKFYQLTGKIALNSLGFTFVHLKKLMKTQFLKYGKTWSNNTILTIHLLSDYLNYGHITKPNERAWVHVVLDNGDSTFAYYNI